MLDLDLVMLHYAVTDKKAMLELSKSIHAPYFDGAYRDFYSILESGLAHSQTKDVMGLASFLDYCNRHGLAHKKDIMGQIYEKASSYKVDGKNLSDQDFSYFLGVFKERYNGAVVKTALKQMSTMLTSGIPVKEANSILEATLQEVRSINRKDIFDEGTVGADIVNIFKEYKEIATNPEQHRGVRTGFPSLDGLTNGFNPGELIVIAGFEGSGKSLLCMNFAVNAWLGSNDPMAETDAFILDGKNILYFSLEMPRSNKGQVSSAPNLNKRIVSCVGRLPNTELRKGSLDEAQLERFKKTCSFIKKYDEHYKLYVIDVPRGATVQDIEIKYLELKQQFNIDMIIVDYIGLMAGVEDENDWEAQGKAAEGLHELARLYRVPVITPVQMTRPGSANHSLNKQNYNNTRVSRSKMITENANIVMMIESRDLEHQYPDMPIHITKNRDGAKADLLFMKDFANMRVYDPITQPDVGNVEKFVDLGDED